MLCTTKSAPLSRGAYVAGRRMSARSQDTLWAHCGGAVDDVTAIHFGSPERLRNVSTMALSNWSYIVYQFT